MKVRMLGWEGHIARSVNSYDRYTDMRRFNDGDTFWEMRR